MDASYLNELVPCFVKRMLQIGNDPNGFNATYNESIEQVWIEESLSLPANEFDGKFFDCILINNLYDIKNELIPALRKLRPYLNSYGAISVKLPCHMKGNQFIDTLDEILNDLGLLRYKLLFEKNEDQNKLPHAVVMVGSQYNPVSHARHLANSGEFGCAIQIIDSIPHDLIQNNKNLALLSAEKQRLYLAWQKSLPPDAAPHMFFFHARRECAQITNTLPYKQDAYQTEAEFWHHIGNDNMAVRTLRSILHLNHDDKTESKLLSLSNIKTVDVDSENSPEWSGTKRPPRLLVISHDFSDYGMDCLYDGLCRVLGKENVIEFPWKPTLHGCNFEAAQNYPCTFNYPARQPTFNEILQALKQNYFDLIVHADVVQMAYPEEIKLLMKTGGNLPVVVYDPWDNCYTPMKDIFEYTGRDNIDMVFKREMLVGVNYGSNAFPLPFSYPEGLITDINKVDCSNAVFWAGKKIWGLRPLYIPKIEQMLDQKFNKSFRQADYQKLLQTSRIGLSFFGSGFDTVRYWEIPAHGVMLLTERPPIRIPHNFVDGQSAVFFEDCVELEEKLNYYLHHSNEASKIADAGHEHLKRYHTSAARARQFLGYLERYLDW